MQFSVAWPQVRLTFQKPYGTQADRSGLPPLVLEGTTRSQNDHRQTVRLLIKDPLLVHWTSEYKRRL